MPTTALTARQAVDLVKAEQRGLPKAGPITLRGQWSGWFHCEGEPRIELTRKLAAYGILRVTSAPGKRWTWTVQRVEKWFSKPGSDTGTAATLLDAFSAAIAAAIQGVA